MSYEMRVGSNATRFENEAEAVEAAKQALLADPDAEPEVIDLATGQPATPGASRQWRDEMKTRIGF